MVCRQSQSSFTIEDMMLSPKADTNYTSYNHNKIKLLLDEPLRSISTMKDKFTICNIRKQNTSDPTNHIRKL